MDKLNFDKNNWNAPKIVETPNIEDDIKQYLGDSVLNKWKQLGSDKKSENLKNTIKVITERLDMISHLKTIAMIVRRKSKYTEKIEGNIKVVSSDCILYGHNFGGLQYDIEALDFYLHLTCIDAIQGQPDYKSSFKWLKNNIAKYKNDNIDFDNAEKDYQSQFGLRKNFIKAFTDDISDALKEKISNVFMVVKMDNNQPTNDSLKAWNIRSKDQKLSKIADTLYTIRSTFTHTNTRSFYPIERMDKIPSFKPKTDYLLWNLNYSLSNQIVSIDNLLENIVKELCLNMLKSN